MNAELTPIKPIIQNLAKTYSMDPFAMMQVIAKVQRDNDIPLINNPKGNIASVNKSDVERITAGLVAFIAKARANV